MSLAQEATLLEYKDEDVKTSYELESKRHHYESGDFQDFFLRPELMRAITDAGFERPSEIQCEAVPHAVTGADILCQAKSGKGKTAVFVISVLHQINLQTLKDNIGCICIAHTRELAYQIKNEFKRFSKYIEGIRCEVFYGGQPVANDIALLSDPNKVPHIAIGTVGRLLQLIKEKHMKTKKVAHFIIDECDKVLESTSSRRDVQQIFMETPVNKQVIMVSATFSPQILEICKKFMQSPVDVIVDDEKELTLHGLIQYYIMLAEPEKTKTLLRLLEELDFNQVVIFVKNINRAKALTQILNESQYPALAIHRGKSQAERIEAYSRFKEFKARIMVATDIFGRGIDAERVNIVINYDMPDNSDSYLHRVGRAGRFGTKGLAITFIASEDDKKVLDQVQARFKAKIEEMPEKIDSTLYSKFLQIVYTFLFS